MIEDKCSLCDVHAHCEDGKCVCDSGYSGEGTKDDCFRNGGWYITREYMHLTSVMKLWCYAKPNMLNWSNLWVSLSKVKYISWSCKLWTLFPHSSLSHAALSLPLSSSSSFLPSLTSVPIPSLFSFFYLFLDLLLPFLLILWHLYFYSIESKVLFTKSV